MKKIICAFMILLCGCVLSSAYAEARYISAQELANKAELIAVGTVSKVEAASETEPGPHNSKVPVKYAEVTVEEVLKGASGKAVFVRFAYNEDMEADVQDPNLQEGQKVLLYLVLAKDKKNSYRVVSGWSGRCMISGDKIYHQYDALSLAEYMKELKDCVK